MSENSPRFLHQYKDTWDSHIKMAREAVTNGYWQTVGNRLKFGVKKEDFDHTQKMTEEMLEALQVLISIAEGNRDKPGVQSYINKFVEGINIHLNRIKKYRSKNNPTGFKTKEHQREEGKFQRLVFQVLPRLCARLFSMNFNLMKAMRFLRKRLRKV